MMEEEVKEGPEEGVKEGVAEGVKAAAEGKEEADQTALRDHEAIDRREETWRRMRQEAAEGKQQQQQQKGPDPWKQTRGGPSENWQPKAWEPAARGKK